MDLKEKNADYHHFFNLFRVLFFPYIMLDKKFSRDRWSRLYGMTEKIRTYIQESLFYLSQEDKDKVFSMLADRMNIRTEAKAMLEKILSSKKSQWPERKN